MQIQLTDHLSVSVRSYSSSVSGSGSFTTAVRYGQAHEPKFFPLTTIQSF